MQLEFSLRIIEPTPKQSLPSYPLRRLQETLSRPVIQMLRREFQLIWLRLRLHHIEWEIARMRDEPIFKVCLIDAVSIIIFKVNHIASLEFLRNEFLLISVECLSNITFCDFLNQHDSIHRLKFVMRILA